MPRWPKIRGSDHGRDRDPFLRLALLANKHRGPILPARPAGSVIEALTDDEAVALYANPKIDPELLEATFTNELGLSGKRLLFCCQLSVRNKSMHHLPEADTFSEFWWSTRDWIEAYNVSAREHREDDKAQERLMRDRLRRARRLLGLHWPLVERVSADLDCYRALGEGVVATLADPNERS